VWFGSKGSTYRLIIPSTRVTSKDLRNQEFFQALREPPGIHPIVVDKLGS